ELTNLNNRRSFMEYIEIMWKQNRRLNLDITVMMLDIDFFKNYNDSMGHLEGDKVLIAVAQCLKEQIKRETDFVARFGGEEFIYLLPFINKNEAIEFANNLVMNVEKMYIPHPMSEVSEFIKISVGVATVVPDENNSINQLLDNADKALYKAKQSGRNKAVIY
ncbi:MAG: GGDEF domain-containing protein, partial [Treponema sp.]|nr:GGDEF domain-containing protein [Treponema sp.]